MSKLFCIRISVSIEIPKASRIRIAVPGKRHERSFRKAESAESWLWFT